MYKRYIIFGLLIIFGLITISNVYATNYLYMTENFTDNTGWTFNDNLGSNKVTLDNAHSYDAGTNAAKFYIGAAWSENTYISKVFDLTGVTYITYKAYTNSGQSTAGYYLNLKWSNGTQMQLYYFAPTGSTGVWVSNSYIVSAWDGYTTGDKLNIPAAFRVPGVTLTLTCSAEGATTGVWFDTIQFWGVTSPTKYYVDGTFNDANINYPVANVLIELQNSGGNNLSSTYTDSNGKFAFDMSSMGDGNYQLVAYNSGFYQGVNSFTKPTQFSLVSGSTYNYTLTMSRYPITRFGSIFTIDSATRYNIFPSIFKISDYDTGYIAYLYSTTGSLYYNYTYMHHYNVTGNVTNYINKTVQVIPYTDNFRGYIEMDYTANMYYDIIGQVFTNDIHPTPLINAVVCWYYSNGSLMVGSNTDGAGYYHLKSPVNLNADTYNVIASSLNYANTTYRLAIPTNFIDKGTLQGTTYYLTGCNIYLSQALANNTSYVQFYVDDLFQSPIPYASVVITSVNDNTKVYSYTTDKYGQLKTPNLPIDNYVFQVTATNFQKGAGTFYNSVANAGQQILVKLAPIGWQNPTQTPTINPSGNPTYIITPTPNPSGNPLSGATVTPNPFTGNSTGSGWGDLANSYLSNFGVTDTATQGIIIGLIITLFCGFCGAAFSSYVANGSSSIVIYSSIFFGAIGFICSCLIGFIPTWVLMVFILILIAALAFMKFGGDK